MRLTRIHTPAALQSGVVVALTESGGSHLVRVLRLREGAAFIAFDGNGNVHHATIHRISGSRVTALIGEPISEHSESPLQLTLVQGISRGERMDWTLQKATELGVTHIVPVLTERSVVKLDDKQASKKQAHWQSVVIGACEQSGRSNVPLVHPPQTLRQYLQQQSRHTGTATRLQLVLSPAADYSLAQLTPTTQHIALLIGPEGGLSDEEVAATEAAGFTSVRLGPRILRTETAAVVALSVLQSRWGDLQ